MGLWFEDECPEMNANSVTGNSISNPAGRSSFVVGRWLQSEGTTLEDGDQGRCLL